MKFYFLPLFIVFFTTIRSQVIINSITNKPISNVAVILKTGQILGISNKDGKISDSNLDEIVKILPSDTVEFNQLDYETEKITWGNFKGKKTFLLNPIKNIDEVVINMKNRDIIVIKSYFISYQIIDNEPQSFSDGIIEYYISLSKNKIINYNILESRIFKNITFINDYYKKLGNTTLSIGSYIRPFDFHEEILLNRWENFTFSEPNEIKFKNDIIGNLIKSDNTAIINVEYYTPSRMREQRILGLSSKITNYSISEKFSGLEPKINNLISISKFYKSFMSQKKVDFKYELIQNVQILEKTFLTKDEFKKLKTDFNHSEKTKYSNKFWEQDGLISIPLFVKSLLHNKLTLVK